MGNKWGVCYDSHEKLSQLVKNSILETPQWLKIK